MTPTDNGTTFGLAALGQCGQWQIDVDHTTSGPEKWFLQIQGPKVYLYFQIPDVEVLSRIRDFIAVPDDEGAMHRRLTLSSLGDTPIELVSDDRHADRYWLVYNNLDLITVHITLAAQDLTEFLEAIRGTIADL